MQENHSIKLVKNYCRKKNLDLETTIYITELFIEYWNLIKELRFSLKYNTIFIENLGTICTNVHRTRSRDTGFYTEEEESRIKELYDKEYLRNSIKYKGNREAKARRLSSKLEKGLELQKADMEWMDKYNLQKERDREISQEQNVNS